MIIICLSFVAGVLAILAIEVIIFHVWFSKQEDTSPLINQSDSSPDWDNISNVLENINSGLLNRNSPSVGKSTASFINVVMLFLFQELREDTKIRAQVLSRINSEISEVLASRLNSKIIKTLNVHNFSAGTSPPKLSNVYISKLKMCEDTKLFRKLHISVDIDYRGCGKLALQASTLLGKNMYISVEVTRLIGKLIFIFNRDPQTHWGFCFDTEPEVEFNVVSAFQQKSLPKFTKVVSSILKMAIRKKHTKPNYKRRYAPLFKEPFISLPPELQFFINKDPLALGKLVVQLISANRVVKTNNAKRGWFYCTVSLGTKLWDAECCPLKQSITFDTVIPNAKDGIGITFNVDKEQEDGESPRVVVADVQRNSQAAESNIRQGDVITAINNKKASSFKAVLAASLSSNRAKLSLKRPLIKWNKLFTSGEASQDMVAFQADAVKDATFVEDETFMILEELELEDEELPQKESPVETSKPSSSEQISESCQNSSECLLRSQYCSMSITPFWDEYFLLKMQQSHQYLTVCLWKEEPATRWQSNPVLVGYCNVSLADVVLKCISTTSNNYCESLMLSLPSDLKWQENIVPNIGSLPQLLPKMACIAGEVKLQVTYCSANKDNCEHSFVVGQVQRSEKCDGCSKKVVHKTAYICSVCGHIRHERCLQSDPKYTPPRHNSVVNRRHDRSSSPTLRQRASSVQLGKSDSGSFSFLKGSEKKAAVAEGKLQDIENKLKEQRLLRKALLGAKFKCPQVPMAIQDQLFKNSESIKNLTDLKDQLLYASE
ncbi:hypothetical protein ACHWQZ_G015630 [Mnemiopsis leidyi]